jgi:protein TonB
MRVKLPESQRDRKRSFGGTAVSTLVHAALIGGALVGTGYTAEQAARPPEPERLVYVAPERTLPEAPAPRPRRAAAIPTNVEPPAPSPDAPPVNLVEVPSLLPPPTTTIGTVREGEFRALPRDPAPVGPVASNEPFTEHMVERPVRSRDGNPSPRYPAFLANAGVEGVVHAQFVVDTAGRVEPGSIRITHSDHVLFERAVRDVLLRSRFHPAELGAQRVRQLVEQAFAFNMRR